MTTLYAATSNAGKLREFALAARLAGIDVLPLPGLDALPEPVEDAPTFSGNADLKAVAYSLHAPGLLVFADDSGLEVDALGGRPGIYSARFADQLRFEPDAGLPRDERNNRCLLSLMRELQRAGEGSVSRGARFVCALSLARNGTVLLRAEGTVEGELLDGPRGSGGFGYDPLFAVRRRGLTLAELTPDEKWAVSHRGNAFRSLLGQLTSANL
ncbi:MAG TPA: non-canonical purine NTP pyrophosphatase [Acidobacteriaceae bacterium]|nr:non-canonical purine NTP pyrophosphatase [Acidobacteriaceae bacterium]